MKMLYNINTKHFHLILSMRWLCVIGIMNNQPLLTGINNYITSPPALKLMLSLMNIKMSLSLPVRFSERQSPWLSKVLRILAFAYPYLFDNIPLFYRVSFSILYSTFNTNTQAVQSKISPVK